jgi:hypothetical protein
MVLTLAIGPSEVAPILDRFLLRSRDVSSIQPGRSPDRPCAVTQSLDARAAYVMAARGVTLGAEP